jgi:transposase InsO family protein
MPTLAELSEAHSFPGADKLYQIARRAGLNVTLAKVREHVKKQEVSQVFHRLNTDRGKTVAPRVSQQWQADLIDMSSHPSGEARYILTCMDVLSHTVMTTPLTDKTPETVAKAFKAILEHVDLPKPKVVFTDQGTEFTGAPFQTVLREKGIGHMTKDPLNKQALGLIDQSIGQIKRRLFRQMAVKKTREWRGLLGDVVDKMSEEPQRSLFGHTPDEVTAPTPEGRSNEFDLEYEAAGKMQPYLEGRGAYRLADIADQFIAGLYTGVQSANALGTIAVTTGTPTDAATSCAPARSSAARLGETPSTATTRSAPSRPRRRS